MHVPGHVIYPLEDGKVPVVRRKVPTDLYTNTNPTRYQNIIIQRSTPQSCEHQVRKVPPRNKVHSDLVDHSQSHITLSSSVCASSLPMNEIR